MNEMELVKQTKEFKIGSICSFSSYSVSAICKTLLNAESDAEYWIVRSSPSRWFIRRNITEDSLVLQVGLMKREKGCHSGFHLRTTWVCVPVLVTTALVRWVRDDHPVSEGVPHLKQECLSPRTNQYFLRVPGLCKHSLLSYLLHYVFSLKFRHFCQ